MFKQENKADLVIIGSGPAGYTAGIYAARSNLKTIIISGNQPGGQLINTDNIENWPGDYLKISGPKLMNRMLEHVKSLKVLVKLDTIVKIKNNNKPFILEGIYENYSCPLIIIATGSSPKYLNIPTEKKYFGKGVSTCAICDGFFYQKKIVAIVGGGNTALGDALYLSKMVEKIHLIIRKDHFKAEKILIKKILKLIKENKIILHINSTINEILGDIKGVNGIKIFKKEKKQYEIIKVFGIFIAIGNTPNSEIFLNIIETENGYIKTNYKDCLYNTQTNIPGIFAAGDVVNSQYRQAIIASSTGCIAALDAERYYNLNKES